MPSSMSRVVLPVVLLSFALLAGCASLSKDECLNADWRTIGYGDAAEGYATSRIDAHRQSCAEYGVRPDLDAYNRGHAEGLTAYCTAPKGYQQGVNGYTYRGICPRELEGPFLEAYAFGKEIRALREGIRNRRHQRGQAMERLRVLDEDIAHTEAALIKEHMAPQKRALLLDDLKRLSAEREATQRQIHELAILVRDMRHRLDELMAENPFER